MSEQRLREENERLASESVIVRRNYNHIVDELHALREVVDELLDAGDSLADGHSVSDPYFARWSRACDAARDPFPELTAEIRVGLVDLLEDMRRVDQPLSEREAL